LAVSNHEPSSRGISTRTVNKNILITLLGLSLAGAAPAWSASQTIDDFLWSVKAGDVTAVIRVVEKNPGLLRLTDKGRNTLLHRAAQYGQVDMARHLLARGLAVNARNQRGSTPLCLAAMFGRAETAKVLLKSGASLNLADNWGWTPLHYAAYYGHPVVAVILLRAGARAGSPDKRGRAPEDLARRRGHKAVIRVLRQFGGG
jgi:ankyrin repeat protein